MLQDRGSEDCLAPGTELLQGQFVVDQFLNAGGFGITYLARDRLERRVVIKECFPTTMCCRSQDVVKARSRVHQPEFDSVVRLFGQEARRLAKLTHPNIVGVHDVFEDLGTAYMVLDHVDGRDLADIIKREPERLTTHRVMELTDTMLDAIDHVHAQGILHRDISPDNILLDDQDAPVLIDFGAARDTARNASRVLSAICVVKDGYSPQEFYLQGTEQSAASDLYALAATLYHILIGEAPVSSQVRLAALAERKPDPHLPLADRVTGYPPAFIEAVDRTLQIFARDRLQSAAEWRALLGGTSDAVTPALDDPLITSTILQLVEETNVEVRAAQDAAQRAAEIEAEQELARQRAEEEQRRIILEDARREAEEAELLAAARVQREAAENADTRDDAPQSDRRGVLSRLIGHLRKSPTTKQHTAMEGVDP